MEARTRGIRNPELKLTRPVSEARKKSMDKRNEKISMAQRMLGLTTDEWRALTPGARAEAKAKLHGADDWYEIQSVTAPKKPRKNPITRMRQWVGGKMEGEVVPEGFVYAIQNVEVPHLLKIGRTYPEGLESRLTEAQRWGRYEIVQYYWFENANHAEKCIHAKLSKWNLRNQGMTDVGTEVFNVSIENFKRAAADHISDLMEETGVAA